MMINYIQQKNKHHQDKTMPQPAPLKSRIKLFSPKNQNVLYLNEALTYQSGPMSHLTKGNREKSMSQSVFNRLSKIGSPSWKSLEKLHQQNSNRKLPIRYPHSRVGSQRIRKQVLLKDIKRVHQKLNTQYCQGILIDDLPNRGHLVQGLKHQYYILKQKYEQKCNELNELHKITANTQYNELKVYCQALQKENIVLKNRVGGMLMWEDKMFKEFQFQQHMEIAQDGEVRATQEWIKEQQINMIELLGVSSKIATLEQTVKQTTANMEKMKEKMEVQRQILRHRKSRIHFLEAAFKRKQNELHEAKWKSSIQLTQKQQAIKNLQLNMQQQQKEHSQAIQALSAKYKKKLQIHKDITQRYLTQSQAECESSKRQAKRVSLLLSSFKDNCRCYSTNINIGKPEVISSNINKETDRQTIDKFLVTFQKHIEEHNESQPFKQKGSNKNDK